MLKDEIFNLGTIVIVETISFAAYDYMLQESKNYSKNYHIVYPEQGDIMICLGIQSCFIKSDALFAIGFLHPRYGYIETLRTIALESCAVYE